METLILIVHIFVCLMLIILVLLQSGKSADLAGAFGGMGSQSTFGPRGAATFISKATTTLAILFMVTSLALFIAKSKDVAPESVMKGEKGEQTQTTDGQKPAAGEEQKAPGTEKPAGTEADKTKAETDKTATDKKETEKKDPGSTDAEKKTDGSTENK